MKNSTSEREKISALEWFQKTFAIIFEKKELIMKDFSKAREEYPGLGFLLQIYSGYFQYLVQWQKAHSRRKRYSTGLEESEIPFPPGPPLPPFPPKTPIDKWVEEINEIAEAELMEISERIKEYRERVRTCKEIVRDFEAAAACVRRYTENLPQNDEEWNEFSECLENLQKYASEMEANGCSL